MEFVADVHISPVTIASLRQVGFEVTRITDSLAATAPDSEIISFAQERNLIIIMQYLDFSALIAHSGEKTPSVISLRLANAEPHFVASILEKTIPQIAEELQGGAIVSVNEDNFSHNRRCHSGHLTC